MTTTNSLPSAPSDEDDDSQAHPVRRGFWEHATDIRAVAGALFACYGTLLTIRGLMATEAAIEQSEGVNINLWTGVAMLLFSATCLYLGPLRGRIGANANRQ
ncbi:hypothetical protein [Mycolicibacterium wolinskyi]|uniref:hypothetical protein n=1 Tax=Mycolicibacterium wolinskyi TaxID=59750 RepID=UPI0039177BC3